jgi:hypothetical protein
MARHVVGDERETIARLEDIDEIAHLFQRPGRAELAGELATRLFVVLGSGENALDVVGDSILKGADQLLAGHGVVSDERRADLVRERSCGVGQQVATDPGPDWPEGRARNATSVLVGRGPIDQERLERTEKQPLGIADAGRMLARLAHRAAHLLQNEVPPGYLSAAQQCALELRDQQSARLRRKLPKKLS